MNNHSLERLKKIANSNQGLRSVTPFTREIRTERVIDNWSESNGQGWSPVGNSQLYLDAQKLVHGYKIMN